MVFAIVKFRAFESFVRRVGIIVKFGQNLKVFKVNHSVSEWILIKSPDQSQRLSQGERGPPRGPEKP